MKWRKNMSLISEKDQETLQKLFEELEGDVVKAGGNASRLRTGRPGITNSTKHLQDHADGQTPARRRQARMSER
jgi:hypothetical protein